MAGTSRGEAPWLLSGPASEYVTAIDGNRYGREGLPNRRPVDALARVGQIAGAVCGALNVFAIVGQKLILDPIHRHGNVATTVDVGVELALVVDDEGFDFTPVVPQHELLRLTRLELTQP